MMPEPRILTKEAFAEQLGVSIEDFDKAIDMAASVLTDDFRWADTIKALADSGLSPIQLVLVGMCFGREMQNSLNISEGNLIYVDPKMN